MSSKALSVSDIDDICVRFEEDWSPQSFQAIRKLAVGGRLVLDASYAELFNELVQIDLERRWKRVVAKIPDLDLLQFELSDFSLPSMEDYLKLPGAQDVCKDVLESIVDCDHKCRMRYGNGVCQSESKVSLNNKNNKKFLPRVKVRGGMSTGPGSLEFQFSGCLWVGRQAVGEPPPVEFVEATGKLVMSSLDDRSISRRSLKLELIAGELAKIENTGRKRNCFAVNDERTVDVRSGQCRFVRLPCTVSWKGLTMYFSRRRSSPVT